MPSMDFDRNESISRTDLSNVNSPECPELTDQDLQLILEHMEPGDCITHGDTIYRKSESGNITEEDAPAS